MKVVLLIPGLKDSKGTGLLRLKPYLEGAGYKVFALCYGWFMLRGIAWHMFNVPLARLIAVFTEILHELGHTVIGIAHSNGAAIAASASAHGAYFDTLVFINGACERDIELGPNTGYLLNCRVPTDPALAAGWLINPVSPWADFDGSMGNVGVKVDADPRQWDINLSEHFGIVASHGGFMSEEKIPETGPWLVKSLKWLAGEGD